MYSSLVNGMYYLLLLVLLCCVFFTIARMCTTFQYQVVYFCQELRVYYQLPVVRCVSLTSLSIACAWPFGWSCALKTIAPILSVTIIFIILPMSLFFLSYYRSTNAILEIENCLCLQKEYKQKYAHKTNLNNPLFRK